MAIAIPGTAALSKGLSILRAIADEGAPPTFARLQKVSGLPKGTLHRILRALIAEGFVRLQPEDKTYHLGLQLLSLAYQVLEDMDIRDLAHGELVRLRDQTGEAAHLAVPDRKSAVYIDAVESRHVIGPIAKIGSSSLYHASAVGKAIAANLPHDRLVDLINSLPLPQLTPRTITSRRALRQHLEAVRSQGYALNEEEEHPGIYGVAAPILGHRGEVAGAICITIPSFRYNPAKLKSYVEDVLGAARAVSVRMGRTVD
jgi:DNA-binding IclR family transcriptional regulator